VCHGNMGGGLALIKPGPSRSHRWPFTTSLTISLSASVAKVTNAHVALSATFLTKTSTGFGKDHCYVAFHGSSV
jgi:hypothetical protein